jgi:CRISPR-associated protein Cmr4
LYKKTFLKIKTISPLHVGSGSALSTVDLPIQREKHTGFPLVHSTSIKGSMRSHFKMILGKDDELIHSLFGDDKENKDENQPACFSVSDCRLFAFPVRSNVSPFILITCPTVLKRFFDDLNYCLDENHQISNFDIGQYDALSFGKLKEDFLLEDLEIKLTGNIDENIKKVVLSNFSNIDENLLVVVSDDVFKFCVESYTDIQANISINENGVTQTGSLRYQEFLPRDSFLYSLVTILRSKEGSDDLKEENILNVLKENINGFLQLGGNQTTGKGICEIKWLEESKGGA